MIKSMKSGLVNVLRGELLRLMLVEVERDWGPDFGPVCRWCGAWVKAGATHDKECFAAQYLDQESE